MTENELEACRRCEYASQLLTEHNIPHEIKKKEIGHINLLDNKKVVMSFWARTGKFIFVRLPQKENINSIDDDRGIKKCIETYERSFKND